MSESEHSPSPKFLIWHSVLMACIEQGMEPAYAIESATAALVEFNAQFDATEC